MGRKPYWGTARPKGWPAILPNGIPGIPAATAGGGATIGVPPKAEPSGLCSGAAAVHAGGTDSLPTMPALPKPAETALPTLPVDASGPAASPLPTPAAAALAS